MTKYEEGDWIIKKKGRKFNWAFKLNEETTLWYSNHDYATPEEIEYAIRVDILFRVRDLFGSTFKKAMIAKTGDVITNNTPKMPKEVSEKIDKVCDEFTKFFDHLKYLENDNLSNEQYQNRSLDKTWKPTNPKQNEKI